MSNTGKLVRKEFKLPDHMITAIKDQAKKEGENESVLIRKALRNYLNSTSSATQK